MDKIILIKLTTRGRSQRALNILLEYNKLANNPSKIKWLISLDHDDSTALELNRNIKEHLPNAMVCFGASHSKIHAINRDVETFTGLEKWDILLSASDDQTPIQRGYDDVIRESMPNDLDASLWFFDGAQPRINTMEIQGHNYYNRLGYIYNPIYKSFYCDNEATEIAQGLGKLIKSEQCIIRHDHPACQHSTSLKNDALYERNQTYWNQDQETFYKRRANNYQ